MNYELPSGEMYYSASRGKKKEMENDLFEYMKSLLTFNTILLGEEYFTAEWNWGSVVGSNVMYIEKPTRIEIYKRDNCLYGIYKTDNNYREYVSFQFQTNEIECQKIIKMLDCLGYRSVKNLKRLINWIKNGKLYGTQNIEITN